MSALGVFLIAGDVADRIWGDEANNGRYFGASFFVFGVVGVGLAVLLAQLLREQGPAPDTATSL